jgi:hypothetical protein
MAARLELSGDVSGPGRRPATEWRVRRRWGEEVGSRRFAFRVESWKL